LWRIVEKEFYAYDQRKLSRAFIHNEQLACAIYNEKGGNEHTKLGRAMHFNVRKCWVPIYDDEEDWEGENDEDENGNAHVRKAIGVQMIEVLEDDLIPDHKLGQTLKYNKPNINELNIKAHLTDDELSLIANDGVDVAGELSVDDEFD
jgi:hypothetical protein